MCGLNGRRFIVLFKQHSIRWFMKMSVWSLAFRQTVASPRGGLGWTCPPHICQRSLLKLIQIRRLFTGGEIGESVRSAPPPDPPCRLTLRARHVCPPHIFWPGDAPADKAYFGDITVKNIYQSFTHKMAAEASWHWNYVTVTLYCYVAKRCRRNSGRRHGESNEPQLLRAP